MKKVLTLLFSLIMVICLVNLNSNQIKSEGDDVINITEPLDFINEENITKSLTTLNKFKTKGSKDSTWDNNTKTLTLNGINLSNYNLTINGCNLIQLPPNSTIVVNGTNSFDMPENESDMQSIFSVAEDEENQFYLKILGKNKNVYKDKLICNQYSAEDFYFFISNYSEYSKLFVDDVSMVINFYGKSSSACASAIMFNEINIGKNTIIDCKLAGNEEEAKDVVFLMARKKMNTNGAEIKAKAYTSDKKYTDDVEVVKLFPETEYDFEGFMIGVYPAFISPAVLLVKGVNVPPEPKPDPTPSPKDESCEKVIGPTWHWNNEKGICEEYATVGTVTR